MSERARPDGGTASRRRAPALGFIYAAVLMNTVSMGVIIPVFPVLVKSLTGQGDAGAAQITGVFGAVWALMSLIFAPIFGNLSDRFGRRPVLLVTMFGLSFDYLVMALAPSIAWLFIGRIISGITSSSGSAAGAYVADISTEEDRARNFGRFQAAANAGVVLGPLLGGFVGAWNPRAPFWVAAGLALANGLYGVFILPESLTEERRAPFHWKRANPIGAGALLVSQPGLLGLAGIIFMIQFAGSSFGSIFQFFTHFRFGWGPPQIALFLVVLSGGNIVMSSVVAGAIAKWIGERNAVILSLLISVAAFLALGLAPTEPLFWAATGLAVLGSFAFPSLMSLLTKRVRVDQQGQLQGALAILFGLTSLVAPLTFTNLFAWSIGPGRGLHLPGLALVMGGVLMSAGLLLAVIYARPPPDNAIIAPESSAD